MIYTIEKRKGRDYTDGACGGFCSWYELRKYSGVSKLGIMLDGETVKDFDTLKEAKTFCEQNRIKYVKAQTPSGCRW